MEKSTSLNRERSRRLLLHYFKMVSTERLDSDCQSEIEEVMDNVYDEIEQVRKEMAKLAATIEDQKTTISGQQMTIEQLQATIAEMEDHEESPSETIRKNADAKHWTPTR